MKPKIFYCFIFILSLSQTAFAEIRTEAVEYRDGDVLLQGYLAYDDSSSEKKPGVLVVHEWKGIGDYSKKRAQMFAELGYVAFAVDMYGKGVFAKDHTEAAQLSGTYRSDRNLMRQRVKAGLDVLTSNDRVNASKIAAVGYCFGGTTVLEIARAGFDVKGVVSFHGGLDAPIPAAPGRVKARVVVMHGAQDPFVKAEQVTAFQNEMISAGADWQFISFGDAVHSFTVKEAGDDPSKGMAYNRHADERSWAYTQFFFGEIFS